MISVVNEEGPIHRLGFDPIANEWRTCKDSEGAIDELDRIADNISKLVTMP
jgi:hypothetical protein